MNPVPIEVPPPIAWQCDDGAILILRPIRADDAERLMSFVRGLSFSARYFRYGRGDYELNEDTVRRLCSPDPEKCVHSLVLAQGSETDVIVGSARIVFASDSQAAELAISVQDEWQDRGVGGRLVDNLLESARQRGLVEVRAQILGTNTDMIEFMRRRGFTIADSAEGAWLKVASVRL